MELFQDQSFTHLLELFFWLFGAFIIGYIFGKLTSSKKEEKTVVDHFSEEDDFNLEEFDSQIRATKTFERGGKQMVQSYFNEEVEYNQIENGLEFKRIGKGSEKDKNDLKLIKGIGKGIEEKLNNIGIYNFKQISNLNSKDIEQITELIKFFPGRIERDKWTEQAKKLLN